ncbi:hypothetical protein PINS_up000401 [Pythium insidiosum]|nr:hypothetical protein PINS_up000401 [Pythium insidiosum]
MPAPSLSASTQLSTPPRPRDTTWLRVALLLSLAGGVLLPIFGLLFRFQPAFVHGIHVDPKRAERNCYIAAACYGGVFLLSGVVLFQAKMKEERAASDATATSLELESSDDEHVLALTR